MEVIRSCFLTRELFTEEVTESHHAYNTIESDEYMIEFRKIKCNTHRYVCRHGQRQHNVLRVRPSIKSYVVSGRSWSPIEDANILLRHQGLSLSESDVQKLARFLDRHRTRVSPGTKVMVVAEIMIRRIEVVNRCVLRNVPINLALEVGSGWIRIVNDRLNSESVSDDNTAQDATADELKMQIKFLRIKYDGSGDDTCSICLDKFSEEDEILTFKFRAYSAKQKPLSSARKFSAMDADEVDANFPLFSKSFKPNSNHPPPTTRPHHQLPSAAPTVTEDLADDSATFADLGLAEWAVNTCKELGIRNPTPVQLNCIPKILSGHDVLGIAQTGSGKTAAFALPILQSLSEVPYGVFALVVTPTRELAYQLAEQFRALGSCLQLRCDVVVGGMDMTTQAQNLMKRPHVVIATPGRLKVLVENNPDIAAVFSRTKFLVLDEADRVLDVGFEDELEVIFQNLPKSRQTLLFSATMTDDLQTLLELSANRTYFYKAFEGFKTVDSLKQQYIFIPKDVKDVYLFHILSKMEEKGFRSAIIFVSTCRGCHQLSLLLEELDQETAALHSYKAQSLRLAALNRFKSGQVPLLIATDVANRGLDIPTVDLVINYDIPRDPTDYVHRVGRTARAGRGGLSVSFVTQNDVNLIHGIEEAVGKVMDKFDYKENEALEHITEVYKARRIATMKMMDDGFEDIVKARKEQRIKTMAQKGLLKNNKKRRISSN
ncbi:unnamed protein product [Rhodiola kirilowii]